MCMLLDMSKQLVYAFPGFYNKETICSNTNLVLICNICKSIAIKLLRTMVISPVYSVVWMSGLG